MTVPKIVVAVSGGIAAFKSAALVSSLVQNDFDVTVVLTKQAQEFVGAATFSALTGRPVATDLFDARYPLGAHIELARDNRLLCVAPATANFMAKSCHGISDDLLSTLYLCFTGPVLIAPAMNSEMWEKSATQRNVEQLRTDGVHFVGPQPGWLSCRTEGVGRMADPTLIYETIVNTLQ